MAKRTLAFWKSRFANPPRTIDCPAMQLLSGRDHEPPIFTGCGHIDVKDSMTFEFTMFAKAASQDDAFRRLVRASHNPYEILDQFRLIATDSEGTDWACGWTRPDFNGVPKLGWVLTGRLNSLMTDLEGSWISDEAGVELMFEPKLILPMDKNMEAVFSVGGKEIERRYSAWGKTLEALNSNIEFFYPPDEDSLWVTARTSGQLMHPHAENWLVEPLRILLGQLIFPRVVARNFGNGRAFVSVRRSPRTSSNLPGLFSGEPVRNPHQFWAFYTKILTFVGQARNEQGHPNFEAHTITRLYEEIVQASQGSRWVLCMTLASAAEAIVRMLMSPDDQKSDFDDKQIESLAKYVRDWKGDKRLRGRILADIARARQKSIASYLKTLARGQIIEESEERAWTDVRSAVMHGNVACPWPTEQGDQNLLALASLVDRLTLYLVGSSERVRGGNRTLSG